MSHGECRQTGLCRKKIKIEKLNHTAVSERKKIRWERGMDLGGRPWGENTKQDNDVVLLP